MENLVKVENDRVAVSSRQIVENFEKQRECVSKALESIKAGFSALTPTKLLKEQNENSTTWIDAETVVRG
jgi:hypothetical protein